MYELSFSYPRMKKKKISRIINNEKIGEHLNVLLYQRVKLSVACAMKKKISDYRVVKKDL